jgi:hypothetical protein
MATVVDFTEEFVPCPDNDWVLSGRGRNTRRRASVFRTHGIIVIGIHSKKRLRHIVRWRFWNRCNLKITVHVLCISGVGQDPLKAIPTAIHIRVKHIIKCWIILTSSFCASKARRRSPIRPPAKYLSVRGSTYPRKYSEQ